MTSHSDDTLDFLPIPRPLRPGERAVLDELLAAPFRGRDALRAQLDTAQVVAADNRDTRTIRLAVASATPRAATRLRVPVEGEAADADGAPVAVLLHVLDGRLTELEVYRLDLAPMRADLTAATLTITVTEELDEPKDK